jgi:hypothetical protein
MKALRQLVAPLFALAMLFGVSSAHADSGWISGTWKLYQKNGNYCPSVNPDMPGRSCTGALYLESEYETTQPLKNMHVRIHNDVKGEIGVGSTDNNGNYLIQWSYSGSLSEADRAKTRVWIRPWHAGNRFRLNNSSGAYPNNWSGYFTLSLGTTQSNPQVRSTLCPGSCSSTQNHYNAYWAAEMVWRTRMNTSGWFQTYFSDLEIRGFSDTVSWPAPLGSKTCTSSCAWVSENKVQLDLAAALKPQARVMHEIGHVAIYNSKPWSPNVDCYNKGAHAGWVMFSDEWACAGFEEAFATLLGATTFYTHNATQPHTCNSAGFCLTDTFNIETSPACGGVTPGWPVTALRYLWDVFDNVNDGETVSEGAAGRWWRLYRNYNHYPLGPGVNAVDEHWDDAYTYMESGDGRGTVSYRQNYVDNYSFETSAVRTLNCSPP